jgi:hypothetical protein
VLEEGIGVTSDDDVAVDEFSLGVLDAAALEDGMVGVSEEDATLDGDSTGTDDIVVLEDRRVELASVDDNSEVLLELGATTIPVGVADDSTEEIMEVSSENVGRGWEETGAELAVLLEDAAGDELMVVSIDVLVDEGTRIDVWEGNTGTITVAELEAGTLEALLDPGAEDAEAAGVEELAGIVLEYCSEGTGMTTVVEDATVKLDPLLIPGAESVAVGYTEELGMTGAGRLDDAEDAEAELGGNGMTTV